MTFQHTMPELPEVETIVRELQKKAIALKLFRCVVIHAEVVNARENQFRMLEGGRVQKVGRVGKYLYLEFDNGCRLWFHLGMTGQLRWIENPQAPDRHVHLILRFEAAAHGLWFRDIRKFGEVFVTGERKIPAPLQLLGPDPFEISSDRFISLFQKRTGKIKNLLLNQRIVSGLGNIYVNESLYRAGIDPRRKPCRLPGERIRRLHGAIREVLDEAIRFGGSSIDDYLRPDGGKGKFQERHRVYGRTGQGCFDCGHGIRRIRISGRSSFFCSHCQK